MRIKFLSFIASFFIVSFVITSCLDDDNNIEYSPDATIHAFELDTTGLGKYKFTIDQLKSEIYNEDSLPVHADTIIDKILITKLTTASGVVTMKDQSGKDSIINIADSIDLRKPIKLKVWSTEALAGTSPDQTREYTISVRVHKHDPDSLRWNYLEDANCNFTGPQRSIILGENNILTYVKGNTGLKLYTSFIDNPTNWSSASITGIDASINDLPTSIITYKKKIYATFKNESGVVFAYVSENGKTWQQSTLTNVELFLAPIKEKEQGIYEEKKISYIKKNSEDKYIFTTSKNGQTEDDEIYNYSKEFLDKEAIKKFPNKMITSYINYENRNGTQGIMLIGEAEQSTTISDGTEDIAIAVAWGYSEEVIPVYKQEGNEPVLDENDNPVKITISRWVDLPSGSSLSYCPELKNPTIIYYNSQFYLFGNGFDSFYTSQSGRDWKKTNKKFSFPYHDWSESAEYDPIKFPEFRRRENYSMVLDNNNYYMLFIFSGGTASFEEEVEDEEESSKATKTHTYTYESEVWRGRLNQLWFDKDPLNAGK